MNNLGQRKPCELICFAQESLIFEGFLDGSQDKVET